MGERCSQAAHHVKDEELFSSPIIFQHIAEHPQRKHVEEDVRKSSVHEHIGDELVRAEFFRAEIMQAQDIGKINIQFCFENNSGNKKNPVNDEQVLYNRRKYPEA